MSEPAWFQNLEREDREFVYALDEARERWGKAPYGEVMGADSEGEICSRCEDAVVWPDEDPAEDRWCANCDWDPKLWDAKKRQAQKDRAEKRRNTWGVGARERTGPSPSGEPV